MKSSEDIDCQPKTPVPKRKGHNINKSYMSNHKYLQSNKSNRENYTTPKSSISKSKVFNFPNTYEEEEEFLKTEIDYFEFWDWV